MTIKEYVKKYGMQMEVDHLKLYQSVDIDFINSEGMEDETQFDIANAATKSGIAELNDLFKQFCKENGFKTNTVTGITIVKSANTRKELETE